MLIHIKPKNQSKQTLSPEEANHLLSRGELDGDEPAWTAGLEEWTILRKIRGITLPEPPPLKDPTERPQTQQDTTAVFSPLVSSVRHPCEPDKEKKTELKGVGGWLLLFCIGLVIFGPLISFGSIILNWELSKPLFQYFPSLKTAGIIENLGITSIAFAGFVVGIGVWRGDPDGKMMAKTYLKYRLIVFIAIEFIAMLIMISLPPEMFINAVGNVVKGIFLESIYFTIWWLYFNKSKRVMNTYGEFSFKSNSIIKEIRF